MRALVALATMLAIPVPSAHATTAPDARVDAFTQICVAGRASYEATVQLAYRDGWSPIGSTEDPQLEHVLALANAATPQGTTVREVQAYAGAGATQSLYLVLTKVDVSGHVVNGCYVYDFEATAPVDDASLDALLGPPSQTNNADGMIGEIWQRPAAAQGVLVARNMFFGDGPAARAVGFSGASLSTSALQLQ